MKKKAIKYTIILLIIPLIISLMIAISNNNGMYNNNKYNGIDIPEYNNTTIAKNNNNTFIYLNIVALVIVSSGIWFYVKKKGDF